MAQRGQAPLYLFNHPLSGWHSPARIFFASKCLQIWKNHCIFAADFQKITNNDKEEISPPLVGCRGSAVVGTVVRASAAGCPEAT